MNKECILIKGKEYQEYQEYLKSKDIPESKIIIQFQELHYYWGGYTHIKVVSKESFDLSQDIKKQILRILNNLKESIQPKIELHYKDIEDKNKFMLSEMSLYDFYKHRKKLKKELKNFNNEREKS